MNDVSDLIFEEIIQQNNNLVEFQGQHGLFENIEKIIFDLRSYYLKDQEILSLYKCIQSNKQMLELEIKICICNLNCNQIQKLTISFSELTQLKKLILDVNETFIESSGLIYIGKAIQNLPQLIHLALNVWYSEIELEGFISFAKYLSEIKSLRVFTFNFRWNLFDDIQQQYVQNIFKKQRRLVKCIF
ncbi:hypothetical protein ABPG72_019463 [Tetrahymena utriculariae]